MKKNLQKLMWEKVGIVRTKNRLTEALEKIKKMEEELKDLDSSNRESLEVKNMILVARLITEAALKRKKSLGAHFITT